MFFLKVHCSREGFVFQVNFFFFGPENIWSEIVWTVFKFGLFFKYFGGPFGAYSYSRIEGTKIGGV